MKLFIDFAMKRIYLFNIVQRNFAGIKRTGSAERALLPFLLCILILCILSHTMKSGALVSRPAFIRPGCLAYCTRLRKVTKVTNPILDFTFLSTTTSGKSRIKNPFLDSPKGTHSRTSLRFSAKIAGESVTDKQLKTNAINFIQAVFSCI